MTDHNSTVAQRQPGATAATAEVALPAEPSKMSIRIREVLAVVLSLGGGIAILAGTQNIIIRDTQELGARFWPTLLGWAIIALAVLLVTTNVVPARTPKDLQDPMTRWGITQLVITFVILIAYLALFNVITLWVITFITCALLLLLYGFRSWKTLVFFPAIIAAVLHLLFVVLLRVPLG